MFALIRRRARGRDQGMTLVELLIASTILMVVIGLSTSFLIIALGKQSNLSQSSSAATQNQTGMETLTRIIRAGVYPSGSSADTTIIQTASATRLVVTAQPSSTGAALATQASQSSISTQIYQYTFTLIGTTLYWQQAPLVGCTNGVCTYGAANPQKVLIRGVQNLNGSAACPANTVNTDGPFHYVTLDPVSGVPSTASAPIPDPNKPATAPNTLGSIAYVTINLYTQTKTGPQAPGCAPLTDYVDLRNR
jgi:type II secretory pathway pseudopilin PulG